MDRTYYVYILASRSRTLYTGVTNKIQRRLAEHREGKVHGFTARYRTFRLVHLEAFSDIRSAITREKEVKGWRREKKIWLIHRHNRAWDDLSEQFAGRELPGDDKQKNQSRAIADPSSAAADSG